MKAWESMRIIAKGDRLWWSCSVIFVSYIPVLYIFIDDLWEHLIIDFVRIYYWLNIVMCFMKIMCWLQLVFSYSWEFQGSIVLREFYFWRSKYHHCWWNSFLLVCLRGKWLTQRLFGCITVAILSPSFCLVVVYLYGDSVIGVDTWTIRSVIFRYIESIFRYQPITVTNVNLTSETHVMVRFIC